MFTKSEEIKNRLVTGYDRGWYESIYRQICYAFGETSVDYPGTSSGHEFPDFPDITPQMQEVGVTRRILNNQFIALSQVMANDPEPEFPDVDAQTATVRQRFYAARANGDRYGEGDWATQANAAFLDGDGLGTGVVQIGLKTNPRTGFKRVTAQHIPLVQCLWDRNARGISRARWIAFLHYVPLDVARHTYGKKFAAENRHEMRDSNTDAPIECVRIFDYWDIGSGLGKPTHAVIPDDISKDPMKVEENPYGCLPFAFYEHLMLPGMRRATGRIPLLMAGQEAMNQIERFMLDSMNQRPFTLIGAELIDEEDMERVKDGDGWLVRMKRPVQPGETVASSVMGGEVNASALQLLSLMERDFTATGGKTDMDKGLNPEDDRTLGENQLVDARSRVQSGWSAMQAAKFHQRMVEVALKVAAVGDNDPVEVQFDGAPVTINDEEDSRMSIAGFLEEPSRVVIDIESLAKTDLAREQAEKLSKLMSLGDLVQIGAVDAKWWSEERLKALGYDPQEAAPQQQVQPAQMPGQPPQQALPMP